MFRIAESVAGAMLLARSFQGVRHDTLSARWDDRFNLQQARCSLASPVYWKSFEGPPVISNGFYC